MPLHLQKIKLNFDSMNVSAQVGDIAYYSTPVSIGQKIGGFDHSKLSTTKKLGSIIGVNVVDQVVQIPSPLGTTATSLEPSPYNINIIVEYDPLVVDPPPMGSFISFVKEKKINTSSLLGYYADAKFINDSTKKAELFSVSSEIAESSK